MSTILSDSVVKEFPATSLQQNVFTHYFTGAIGNSVVVLNWDNPVEANTIIKKVSDTAAMHPVFSMVVKPSFSDGSLMQFFDKGLIVTKEYYDAIEFDAALDERFNADGNISLYVYLLFTEDKRVNRMALVSPPFICDVDGLLLLLTKANTRPDFSYQHFSEWCIDSKSQSSYRAEDDSIVQMKTVPCLPQARTCTHHYVKMDVSEADAITAAFACVYPYLEPNNDGNIQVSLSLNGRIFEEFETVAGPFRMRIPLSVPPASMGTREAFIRFVRNTLDETEEAIHRGELIDHGKPQCLISIFNVDELADDFADAKLSLSQSQAKLSVTILTSVSGALITVMSDLPDIIEEDVHRLVSRIGNALKRINQSEHLPLAEIGGCTRPDFDKVIVGDKTLCDLYADAVDLFSDRIAFSSEDKDITFFELNEAVTALSSRLCSLGSQGDRVLLFADRSLEAVVGLFGILQAGMVYVPVLPENPDQRVKEIVQQAEAVLAIAQPDSVERASRLITGHVIPALGHPKGDAPVPKIIPSDTAYIIFTSGSTGLPKGVAVAHHSAVNLLNGLNQCIYNNAGNSVRVSLNAPLAFDASVKQVLQILLGRTVVAIPRAVRIDPDRLISFIQHQRINVLDVTPTILSAMIERGFRPVNGFPERILIGGEAICQDLWDSVSGWPDCVAWNVYGPTEATVNTLVARIGDTPYPVLGKPLPNVQTAVVDSQGYELPVGAVGELLIAGAGVAQGYIGACSEEQKKFSEMPDGTMTYRTGDLVCCLMDGNYFFIGRADEQVKIAGQRLELGEIRSLLERHPSIRQAAVMIDKRNSETRIVAAVTPVTQKNVPDNGMLYVQLPNGLNVASVNVNETRYQYKEIFEDKIYTNQHLVCPQDAVVFDVGANIGMFTLFVAQHIPNANIFAFEPLAPIRERLLCNINAYAPDTTVLPYALSNQNGETEFTYYPGYSMMSGQAEYADAEAEKSVISRFLSNSVQQGDEEAEILLNNVNELLSGRFDGVTLKCQLRRLSDVIEEHNIQRIDLLKIDVQRAEMDVLLGIDDRHFDIIRSIALEVHDDPENATSGRMQQITALLGSRGFDVFVNQDELLNGTDRWNCIAWRVSDVSDTADRVDFSRPPASLSAPLDSEAVRHYLAAALPAYMLPDRIAILDALPVTSQGKLDRKMLLSKIDVVERTEAKPDPLVELNHAPEEDKRKILLDIWCNVLRKPELSENDNFFLNGGDSIRAIMMQSQARKAGISLSLEALNATPTVAELIPELKPSEQDRSALLLDIWRNVLRKPELSKNDDFFLNGGDSIRAIMMQSQARKAGYSFTLGDLHDYPVFADFSSVVLNAGVKKESQQSDTLSSLVTNGTKWTPSSLQQMMLLATLVRRDERLYHNATITPVHTQFDEVKFRHAVTALRLAHPILSARLVVDAAGMTFCFDQQLAECRPVVRDLSEMSCAEAEKLIADAVLTERDTLLHPLDGDLVRITAFIRGPSRFDILVAEHHAVLDGMSLNAAIAELVRRYQGKSYQSVPDIAVFNALDTEVAKASESDSDSEYFWRNAFKKQTEPSPLALPRERAQKADMHQVDVHASDDAIAVIDNVSQQLGASRKAILFALHARALEGAHGTPCCSLGVVYSLRPETEGSENAVGMFLNVLPVPVEGSELKEIARGFDAFDRRVFPFKAVSQERLRDWTGPYASIDSIFNFISFSEPDSETGDVHETEHRYFAVDAYVPLAVDWDFSGDRLAVGFQYDRNRLDCSFADRLRDALRNEIETLIGRDNQTKHSVESVLRSFGLNPHNRHEVLAEAGLSSIDQLRLAGAVRDNLQIAVNPVEFMQARTVSDITSIISAKKTGTNACLVELSVPQRYPKVRIIGFPLTGAAPSAFDPWCDRVPAEVAVHAFQFPDKTQLQTLCMQDLADAIANEIKTLPAAPLVFVGCSFGAVIAYETAKRLSQKPKALYVIGSPAPLPGFILPAYHLMQDTEIDDLLRKMRTPDAQHQESEVLPPVRETLRAVSRLAQRYVPDGERLTGCDIVSVWPQHDGFITFEQMQSWEKLTDAHYQSWSVNGAHAMLVDDAVQLYEQCRIDQLLKRLLDGIM